MRSMRNGISHGVRDHALLAIGGVRRIASPIRVDDVSGSRIAASCGLLNVSMASTAVSGVEI